MTISFKLHNKINIYIVFLKKDGTGSDKGPFEKIKESKFLFMNKKDKTINFTADQISDTVLRVENFLEFLTKIFSAFKGQEKEFIDKSYHCPVNASVTHIYRRDSRAARIGALSTSLQGNQYEICIRYNPLLQKLNTLDGIKVAMYIYSDKTNYLRVTSTVYEPESNKIMFVGTDNIT